MLVLKTKCHKTHLVALKRTIRASLKLLDTLGSDKRNIRRNRNKIPRASALKGNKPVCHRMLLEKNKINIAIKVNSWTRTGGGGTSGEDGASGASCTHGQWV